MKETPTELSVESPSRSKFCDNRMGEAEKLNNKIVKPIVIAIVPGGKIPPSMGKISSLELYF